MERLREELKNCQAAVKREKELKREHMKRLKAVSGGGGSSAKSSRNTKASVSGGDGGGGSSAKSSSNTKASV